MPLTQSQIELDIEENRTYFRCGAMAEFPIYRACTFTLIVRLIPWRMSSVAATPLCSALTYKRVCPLVPRVACSCAGDAAGDGLGLVAPVVQYHFMDDRRLLVRRQRHSGFAIWAERRRHGPRHHWGTPIRPDVGHGSAKWRRLCMDGTRPRHHQRRVRHCRQKLS